MVAESMREKKNGKKLNGIYKKKVVLFKPTGSEGQTLSRFQYNEADNYRF